RQYELRHREPRGTGQSVTVARSRVTSRWNDALKRNTAVERHGQRGATMRRTYGRRSARHGVRSCAAVKPPPVSLRALGTNGPFGPRGFSMKPIQLWGAVACCAASMVAACGGTGKSADASETSQ